MNRNAHMPLKAHTRQHGFNIVELMVAITISLILLAGVAQLFLSNKASHNVQNGKGLLQENARFALEALATGIVTAGYDIRSLSDTAAKLDLAATQDNAVENATLSFTMASGRASDNIAVVHSAATDCMGMATGGLTTDLYYINGTTLMCLGSGGTAGVIADGVENMQILYGLDTDADDIANSFVSAASLNTGNVNNVVSVKIALLVSTVDTVGQNAPGDYTVLNAPALGPFTDNRLRQVFSRTILLRNRV
ncbi:MAG: PilW family protein [Pseudomonadota bacterium]